MSEPKPRSRAKKAPASKSTVAAVSAPLAAHPVAPFIPASMALPAPGTDLFDYFASNSGRLIFKWMHYFDIYEKHFAAFRGRDIKFLEIGVFHGGSLQMWKNYFGPRAQIIGVDINPACKAFEEDGITIEIGRDRKSVV